MPNSLRLSVILLLIISSNLLAQEDKQTTNTIDGTVGVAKRQASIAFHYNHLWKLGKKRNFSIGWGARATIYKGVNQYYITAPAKLTSESTSPLIFFSEIIKENIDTFYIRSPQINSVNLSINMQHKLFRKLSVGFNIDVVGFSFGRAREGLYINGTEQKQEHAKPTPFNILLISDNDRGSLNSELFLKHQTSANVSIKLGAQFLFTEYTTDTNVQQLPDENDRFRRKSFMVGFGVSYQLQ